MSSATTLIKPWMLLLEEHSYHLLSLKSTDLMEKMSSNQGWSEERTQTNKRGRGMHQLKEVDMLATKMDLLMKRLDERSIEKKEVMHIHDSGMTCEEYGETRHTGTNCLEVREDVNYIKTTTTTTTILNKIKARACNSGLTTQVISKVIILTITLINHL